MPTLHFGSGKCSGILAFGAITPLRFENRVPFSLKPLINPISVKLMEKSHPLIEAYLRGCLNFDFISSDSSDEDHGNINTLGTQMRAYFQIGSSVDDSRSSAFDPSTHNHESFKFIALERLVGWGMHWPRVGRVGSNHSAPIHSQVIAY